jgi:nucleotide-binding universal stress UspA family protein
MNAAVIPVVPAIEIKRILYATDFSPASAPALPVISALARRYGSRVFAAHVCSAVAHPMVAPQLASALDHKHERETKAELEKLLQFPAFSGLDVETLVRSGEVVEQLARMVRQKSVNLVVAGTHGLTGFKHHVLGSVAEELVRSLGCPVLTVGPKIAKRFETAGGIDNILFPTDFSEESLSVFPYLASLANEYRSRITVLHVLPIETAGNPEAPALAEPLRQQMEKALAHQLSPRCTADFVVKSGDPEQTILEEARRRNADLIGLGVRGATDIARHFRETVAYRILAEAECPVLTHHAVSRW